MFYDSMFPSFVKQLFRGVSLVPGVVLGVAGVDVDETAGSLLS